MFALTKTGSIRCAAHNAADVSLLLPYQSKREPPYCVWKATHSTEAWQIVRWGKELTRHYVSAHYRPYICCASHNEALTGRQGGWTR